MTITSSLAVGIWLGLGGVASAAALTYVTDVEGDQLTLIERYGVFGLHSMIVLGIGVWMCRSLLKMVDNVQLNTNAVTDLAHAIQNMIAQNSAAHATYAAERDKAVNALTRHVDDAKDQILRELVRKPNSG